MNPLVKNPETGFLESGNDHNSFTSARKVEFLRIAHEFIDRFNRFPSIHTICKEIGVSVRNFDHHKQHDPAFRAAWHEITSALKYVYVSNIAEKAESKNGIIAALSIQRYLETGSFIPNVQINSTHNNATEKTVIDAVIVESDPEVADIQGNIPSNQSPPAT